jgi:ribulose-phosphate 3-epimerase
MIKIAPSLASAPLVDLKGTVHELEHAGSDLLHFDVEDGYFVPLMTLGVKIVQELRPLTKLPFDVHLMMVNPEWLIPELARMGADRVSVHCEACPYPRRTLRMISELGMQAGLAFNPATLIPPLDFCLPYLTYVVVLSTEPEAGDCLFLPSVLSKVVEVKNRRGMENIEWVVDGGIKPENIQMVAEAGVEIVVAGRSIFSAGIIEKNIRRLRESAGINYGNKGIR